MAGDSNYLNLFTTKKNKNTQQKFKKIYNLLDRNYKHRNNTILSEKSKNSDIFAEKVSKSEPSSKMSKVRIVTQRQAWIIYNMFKLKMN